MDYDKNYPVCLMGEGNMPLEDVGRIFGYIEFLNIISNSKHEKLVMCIAGRRVRLVENLI